MLLNLSNHSAEKWQEAQLKAARQQFASVVDMPFPAVDPDADDAAIIVLASQLLADIRKQHRPVDCTVHVMGECTLCFALVHLLQRAGFTCVASTTARKVTILNADERQTTFQFVQFRKYPSP